MNVVPCCKVKVVSEIVAGSMASLKVAVKLALIAAVLEASTGTVEVTVGLEVLGVPPSPPPPPHPVINVIIKNAADHSSGFFVCVILLIFISPNISFAITSTTFFYRINFK
jgi:hypothetical protein